MTDWKGKSRGTPLGYRIFIFTISRFGLRPAYFLLVFVAGYFFLFSYKSSKNIYTYLKERQGFGRFKSVLGIYRNYYVFGQILIDKIVVLSGLKQTFTFSFDGEENLQQMTEGKRGGVLLSAHVGNWEVAGHLLERLDTTINVVMYDGENQKIKDAIEESAGKTNFRIIPVKNDLVHIYSIHEALAGKELVCIHADRFMDNAKTATMTFMRGEAKFPAGVFAMAAGMNVPVSIVFAFKETSTHYHFFGSTCFEKNGDETKTEFANRLANSFVQALEEKMKLYPYQWFNYYDFWKK